MKENQEPKQQTQGNEAESKTEQAKNLLKKLPFKKKSDNAQNNTTTHEERNDERQQEKRKLRVRLVPIWLRLLILLILCLLAVAVGTMVGYGLIGKGNMWDVFEVSTWEHIYNIIFKNVTK